MAAEPYGTKFFTQMASIFVPANVPLFLAVGKQQPTLIATAVILNAVLAKMTANGSNPVVASLDKELEQQAMTSLVATSTMNRTVRILMGSCHIIGAVLYNVRRAKTASEEAPTVWQTVTDWMLTLALCIVAGIFLSTGYYGQ